MIEKTRSFKEKTETILKRIERSQREYKFSLYNEIHTLVFPKTNGRKFDANIHLNQLYEIWALDEAKLITTATIIELFNNILLMSDYDIDDVFMSKGKLMLSRGERKIIRVYFKEIHDD